MGLSEGENEGDRMKLDQACDLVNLYATTDGYRLAMHKVSKETGYSTSYLAKEMANRRKARRERNKKMKERKNKVPDWVLNGKDWS